MGEAVQLYVYDLTQGMAPLISQAILGQRVGCRSAALVSPLVSLQAACVCLGLALQAWETLQRHVCVWLCADVIWAICHAHSRLPLFMHPACTSPKPHLNN